MLAGLVADADALKHLIFMTCQPMYVEKGTSVALANAAASSLGESYRFRTQIPEAQVVGKFQLVWRDGVVEETGDTTFGGGFCLCVCRRS